MGIGPQNGFDKAVKIVLIAAPVVGAVAGGIWFGRGGPISEVFIGAVLGAAALPFALVMLGFLLFMGVYAPIMYAREKADERMDLHGWKRILFIILVTTGIALLVLLCRGPVYE